MKDLRLAWEPVSVLDSKLVSEQVTKYMDNQAAFLQFSNDTCLMVKPVADLKEAIVEYHRKARYITQFKVFNMEDGNYLIFFASPLIVYVGKQEFLDQENEIKKRIDDLKFPSEIIVPLSQERDDTNYLVGLYARGKLQRDAWSELNYTFIKSDSDNRFVGTCLEAIAPNSM
jgi:hypothetical protein